MLAIDLGATSGRSVVGVIKDGKLQQTELTRFANPIIQLGGHSFWDIFALYNEIIKALRLCGEQKIPVDSIGIDTWGVDFVCFGADGMPLRNPYCYRDLYTTRGIMDEVFARVPKAVVYDKTGIQFMNFNSLFQLAEQKRSADSAMSVADKVLFIPDALSYMLTGKAVCEHTILSTSQLMNPRTGQFDEQLLDAVGLQRSQFGDLVQPGTIIGTLTPEVQKLTGLGALPVMAVAGHDTASAVAAVPASDENYAYLSCGTWSLLGIETLEPIINDKSFEYNFTNEGGIFGTTRFLKNICGLWLLERCRQEWDDAPADVAELCRQAEAAESCGTLLNPDDPLFANPDSMLQAIAEYCSQHALTLPQGYAQTARCIFESLANRYAEVVEMLRELSPVKVSKLHVIGGGSQNAFLMQLAANRLGMPVVAGPVEGTAMGNIMMQAYALGRCSSLAEMRRIIANSVSLTTYMPSK